MKSMRTLLIIALIVSGLILIKVFFFPSIKKAVSPVKGATKIAVPVAAFVVKPQRFESGLQSTGTIYANAEAELRAEIAGRIISINFKEGGQVSKGDLLIKINDADLNANLRKLIAQFKQANDKLQRQTKLLEIGGISREEFEMNQTEVISIQSDIDYTRAQIAKTEIRAPFSGSIGLRNISEGNYVTANNVIANIQQLTPVKIDFSVPEKYLAFIRKGNKIKFTVDASDKSYEGDIAAIEPMIDPVTRTIKVRAYAPNQDKTLFPGSFAHIAIILNISENSILIPTQSVVPILKGKKVFVSRNGMAEEIVIETGERTTDMVQVLKGLTTGDTVLTTGILQLRKGSPLKFTEIK